MVKVTQVVNSEARIWTHDGLILKPIFLFLYTTYMIIVENKLLSYSLLSFWITHKLTKILRETSVDEPNLTLSKSLDLVGVQTPKGVCMALPAGSVRRDWQLYW